MASKRKPSPIKKISAKKRTKSSRRKKRKISKKQQIQIILILLLTIIVVYFLFLKEKPIPNAAVSEKDVKQTESIKTAPEKEKIEVKNTASQKEPEKIEQKAASKPKTYIKLELPEFSKHDVCIVENTTGRYTMKYDTSALHAKWVAHMLTCHDVRTIGTKRTDDFRVDTSIVIKKLKFSTPSDYKSSGYDKGHLLPSADRNNNHEENSATFLMSNIAPQTPMLNRGEWANLENKIRDWADKYDSIYIITGTIIHQNRTKIGKNEIAVPDFFFKAILSKRKNGEYKSIAFVAPNRKQNVGRIREWVITVDSLEKIISLNLFKNLEEPYQTIAESQADIHDW